MGQPEWCHASRSRTQIPSTHVVQIDTCIRYTLQFTMILCYINILTYIIHTIRIHAYIYTHDRILICFYDMLRLRGANGCPIAGGRAAPPRPPWRSQAAAALPQALALAARAPARAAARAAARGTRGPRRSLGATAWALASVAMPSGMQLDISWDMAESDAMRKRARLCVGLGHECDPRKWGLRCLLDC